MNLCYGMKKQKKNSLDLEHRLRDHLFQNFIELTRSLLKDTIKN